MLTLEPEDLPVSCVICSTGDRGDIGSVDYRHCCLKPPDYSFRGFFISSYLSTMRRCSFGGITMDVLKKLISGDNAVKYLLRLEDGNTIETLYMHDKDLKLTYHSTVCVSSQVGCKIGCIFCATGKQGFVRNLSADEIFEQVSLCNLHCLSSGIIPVDAVVLAGMGEPLLNYKNVAAAMQRLHSDLGISNFEIATIGIIPGIYRLIEDFKNGRISIRLNLSLHASNDEHRKKLIPSAQYDIKSIINSAVDFAAALGTRVRIRYALFKGLNDSDEDIERLCALLEGKPVKIIISRYNDNNVTGLAAPGESEVVDFFNKIRGRIDCGIFHNFGSDIKGGCGQLRQAETV